MTDDLLADRADRDTHEMVIAPPVGMMDVPIHDLGYGPSVAGNSMNKQAR